MVYPPPNHYLTDLGGGGGHDRATHPRLIDLEPGLCAPGGGAYLGVLATAIDMAGGSLSRRHADPEWVATSDIAIELVAPVRPGPCRVDCILARRGRGLITLDLDLRGGHGDDAPRCGVATAAFAVLPNPGSEQGGRRVADEPRAAAAPRHPPGPRASLPLHERIGVRVLDAAGGIVEAELVDYVRNTFGALQGGIVAVLAEAAMLAATGGTLASLLVRYRTLGRVGPFRTRVDRLEGALGAVARATLRDDGAQGAVVAVAAGRLAG
jgi:acyl-coenzyme A thioesterase PaaI-like protein